MTRYPSQVRPTTSVAVTRRGRRERRQALDLPRGRAAIAARPRSPAARAARVATGSVVAVGVMIVGLRLTFSVRHLTEPAGVARPDLLEVGIRCAGIALMAAAQIVLRAAVVGAVYPLRRGDWTFEMVAWTVMGVAAIGAIAFGLSGW